MKKAIALFFLTLYSSFLFACSTFLLNKDGQLVFGRNYDWVTGNGAVMINARGIKKTSFAPDGGKAITWVSDCGSVTFNQFGKEFPHGGMNERGLVVELMWLSETTYPIADQRAAMNELQWIQYQLDNAATVSEVIASDSVIRISRQNAAPLHYLIADAHGDAATIEFINGEMKVHRGKDLPNPVLTNTVYADAMRQVTGSDARTTSYGDNSVDRFAMACRMVQQFQTTAIKAPAVDYTFSILDKIAQGSFTQWRIAYDITNRQVHFETQDQGQRKTLSFKDVDFACNTSSTYFPLSNKQKGNIATYFSPLSFQQNQALIEQSARESQGRIDIPPASIAQAAAYMNTTQCGNK
ncbi:MAG TPA: linear amide C-N hydrolase [Flavisolibacter sp.]|nr:linear amide C-N hydrolase [Flavisolibacter sp.]